MDKLKQDQSQISINDLMIHLVQQLLNSQNDLSKTLNQICESVGEKLDVDRISLFYYDSSKHLFYLAHEWCNLGIEPRQSKNVPVEISHSETYLNTLNNKNPLIFEDLTHVELQNTWLSYLDETKVKAFLGIPIHHGNQLWGYLSFENQRRPQSFEIFDQEVFHLLFTALSLRLSYENLNQEVIKQEEKVAMHSQNKYTFFANVSHEVRTPLNGVHNALYLLQTTDLSKEQKTYLDMANESVDGISSIVERILDLEALESGKLEIQTRSFNIEDEMIRLVRMYQRQIEQKKLEFNWNFDYSIMHEVIGDERKLRHILAHILHNAIKFTDEGSITLSVQKIDDENYIFTITDTGIGISKDHIGQIYDAFYQINMSDQKEFQGLGIGLTVAYELAKLLKGKLHIESEVQVGTTVSLELKLQTGKLTAYKDIQNVSVMLYHDNKPSLLQKLLDSLNVNLYDEESIGHSKVDIIIFETPLKHNETIIQMKELYGHEDVMTFALGHMEQKKMNKTDGVIDFPVSRSTLVQKLTTSYHEMRKSVTSAYTRQLSGVALVVDDNRLNRVALESILNKLGIQAKLAESGAKAIEMVKQDHFDLILMDIQMPHMDGIEATRRIRSLGSIHQTVPIVAVTANAYFNDYDMLKASQINDVIFKPIKMESLGQMLRKYLTTTETIHIPEEMVVFDRADFLKRFEGSYDIAKEVIETFQAEYPKDLNHIKDAIATKDDTEIIKAAHYYKGSCAYLSGKRLVWLLNRMMDQAKQNIQSEMADLMQILIKESEELIKELQTMKVIA